MEPDEREQKISDILNRYGIEQQLEKCEEELIECLFELRRFRHKKSEKCTALIGEIADALVTLTQLKIYFGKDNIEWMMDAKIKKTLEPETGVS